MPRGRQDLRDARSRARREGRGRGRGGGLYRAAHPAATLELLDGLERLPPLTLSYKGVALREFDLDGAIARRPQLILVDELAHTNAEGCRHRKRYQDIEELLKAGVDVYTTVNVQHIESLNDIVASITGVIVPGAGARQRL